MVDPMDALPPDYGSDRYDAIAISAPADVEPAGAWWDWLVAHPCEDCRPNIFGDYAGGSPTDPGSWHFKIAHDNTCPTLRRIEQQEGPSGRAVQL